MPAPVCFLSNDWDSNILPYLQAQGTVTAVQLQTEAPVVTASGQQVQTLQVVVSPPACVGVMRVAPFACSELGCFCLFVVVVFTHLCAIRYTPFLAEHVLQLLKLHAPQNTVWCEILDFCFWRRLLSSSLPNTTWWWWQLLEMFSLCCSFCRRTSMIHTHYGLSFVIIELFLFCCGMRHKHLVIYFGCKHIYGCNILFLPVVNASQCDASVLCNHVLLSKSLTLCNLSRNVDVSTTMFTMEGLIYELMNVLVTADVRVTRMTTITPVTAYCVTL